MLIFLLSNTLSVAHGIESATTKTQYFFYKTLVIKANSTIIKSNASTMHGFPKSLCMHTLHTHYCIVVALFAHLTWMALSAFSDMRAHLYQLL